MSIADLLQAAEYLERRDREAEEHGYACPLPAPSVGTNLFTQKSNHYAGTTVTQLFGLSTSPIDTHEKRLNKQSSRKPQGNRSTHNELEKNRRAHLRHCLEKLKDIVPLGADTSRHTTLGLLNKAKHFIKTLEEKDRRVQINRDGLLREQRFLRRRLELLSSQVEAINKRRSLSECSTSTVSSSHSSNSESDDHEVDVMGYNGSTSDDDHSSVRSSNSDGGVTITTWKQLAIDA